MHRSDQEKDWLYDNRDLKDGTWRKIQGHELTQEDVGLEVKYLHFIAWEDATYDVQGILEEVQGLTDAYYSVAKIENPNGDHFHSFYGNVYGDTLYVKKRVP